MTKRRTIRLGPRRRQKRTPRKLEKAVVEIARRPAPIRRNLFDLIRAFIAAREVVEAPPDPKDPWDRTDPKDRTDPSDQPPTPPRKPNSR